VGEPRVRTKNLFAKKKTKRSGEKISIYSRIGGRSLDGKVTKFVKSSKGQ